LGGSSSTTRACLFAWKDEELIQLRPLYQPRFDRIVPHVLPLFQKLLFITNNSIKALCLPHKSAWSEKLINEPRADAFDPFHDVRKIKPCAGRFFSRLEQQMHMIRHNHRQIKVITSATIKRDVLHNLPQCRLRQAPPDGSEGNEVNTSAHLPMRQDT